MLDIGTCLRWYKKPEVQQAILESARGKEIAVKYGDRGFGKRPELIAYPKDILELVQNGATSFHVSEEHWENTAMLSAGLSPKQLDALRSGWDLVLDIDCPLWEYSKLITQLTIKLLRRFKISSVSVKFSGNKGFHVGVPFAAFPPKFNGVPMRLLFPEAPRRIATYITSALSREILTLIWEKEEQEIAAGLGKEKSNLFIYKCGVCGAKMPLPKPAEVEYICPHCATRLKVAGESTSFMVCPKCKRIMEKVMVSSGSKCRGCGSTKPPIRGFDISQLLKIDAVLLSSRHLYRSAYSLHESSGLVSLPFSPDEVLKFERGMAEPSKVKLSREFVFLDASKTKTGEALGLLIEAYDSTATKSDDVEKQQREFELPKTPVSSELFPPCINAILAGLEDGRKRALFILLNFLGNMGWDKEKVEKFVKEWNERNRPPLKPTILLTHLSNFRKAREVKLPPNCDNPGYYTDIRVCHPDNFCKRIKNPANYYKVRARKRR